MNQGLGVINSKNLPENSRTQVFVVFAKAVGEYRGAGFLFLV